MVLHHEIGLFENRVGFIYNFSINNTPSILRTIANLIEDQRDYELESIRIEPNFMVHGDDFFKAYITMKEKKRWLR